MYLESVVRFSRIFKLQHQCPDSKLLPGFRACFFSLLLPFLEVILQTWMDALRTNELNKDAIKVFDNVNEVFISKSQKYSLRKMLINLRMNLSLKRSHGSDKNTQISLNGKQNIN